MSCFLKIYVNTILVYNSNEELHKLESFKVKFAKH